MREGGVALHRAIAHIVAVVVILAFARRVIGIAVPRQIDALQRIAALAQAQCRRRERERLLTDAHRQLMLSVIRFAQHGGHIRLRDVYRLEGDILGRLDRSAGHADDVARPPEQELLAFRHLALIHLRHGDLAVIIDRDIAAALYRILEVRGG